MESICVFIQLDSTQNNICFFREETELVKTSFFSSSNIVLCHNVYDHIFGLDEDFSVSNGRWNPNHYYSCHTLPPLRLLT
mmetsp:Transcript_13621/g.20688  ORF Transcript_13621/g.20688 Transcript_13621/m.20688 type:complete len:80 (+) Transcript_13621:495-734(+)